MKIRDLIIERPMADIEIGKEAKDLINSHRYNQDVYDEDYDMHPLYALLKIMIHVRRSAFIIARKNLTTLPVGDNARSNYIVYQAYMKEYQSAYNEFIKHFQLDAELADRLEEAKDKLVDAIAVKYDDDVSLMMDIVDTNSCLYGIEGIDYAR